jgi:hypothetical protein
MKPVRLIKICLNKTHSEVLIGKNLFDTIPLQNGQKYGDVFHPLFFKFALLSSEKSKKIRKYWNCMEHISSCSMLAILIRRA